MEQVFEQPDTLHSGLETAPELDRARPAMRVSTIRWYSGFRDSGLRVGDRIVAVNGRAIAAAKGAELAQLVGQYAEHQAWAAASGKDGDEVALTALRRAVPGRGHTELTFRGKIANQRAYRNAENRPLFGPGGPVDLDRDQFSSAWTAWHDEMQKLFAAALDDPGSGSSRSSDYALGRLREHEPRLRHLVDRHPGPYARAMAADFELARAALEGRSYTLSEDELAWRRRNEARVAEVAAAGQAARTAFVAARAAELVPPFPSVDPLLGDRGKFAGKLVELPEIGNREWISQGARSCLVWNLGEDWYTVAAEGDEFQKALHARARYQQTVSEALPASFSVIGRVLSDPTQVVVGDRSHFAFVVEPACVWIGRALFVDVSRERGPQPAFAGEERPAAGPRPPPDAAAPEQVMETFFGALKLADRALWRSLFASFDCWFSATGMPIISPSYLTHEESMWGQARRAILDKVYEVRMVWCDEPRTIVTGQEFAGAPRIEETVLDVDHVGRREDGSYRSFTESGLRRRWTLWRRDGGPWRIATQSGI